MLNSVDFSGRPFHFIGIGGIGMSALAYVLAKRQLPVSGSDLRLSHITQRLEEQGAHIFWSQDAANLTAFLAEPAQLKASRIQSSASYKPAAVLPQVVCSTAIGTANPEYRAALELGCPIFHRSDILAALIQDYQGIAIAGTHGKTTTSGMTGYLLLNAGLDPTIIIGGEVNAWEGNARVGQGSYLVAEADESDGSLVKLAPQIGVITNIELDHPDHYSSLDEVIHIFQTFANNCQTVVGCIDCLTVKDTIQPDITYSIQHNIKADYTVDQVAYGADGTIAQVWERGALLGRLHLKLLGQHNLSNALAAIAVGRLVNLDFATIAATLSSFGGARRRFEHRGEHHRITFIDDYAHHPSELSATLSAARLRLQGSEPGRLIAVFQPHRYSRTLKFLNEFAQAFNEADVAVLTDIYSAGEPNRGEITGLQLTQEVSKYHPQAIYQPTLADVLAYLKADLIPGDLVLFLGAGNLNQIIPELTTFYQQIDQSDAQPSCSQL